MATLANDAPVEGGQSKPEKKTTVKAQDISKPNEEEYAAKIQIEKQAIDALYRRQAELDSRIKEQKAGQAEYNQKRNALREDLDAITRQIQDLEKDRSRLFTQIDELQKSGRDMKTKVQAMKRNLGFQSEEEIEAKIRVLERHMMGRSLSVQEENKLIAQMKQLQNSKPLVEQYAHLEANAAVHSQTAIGPLRSRHDKIKDELRECQQTKRDLHDKLRALIDKNQRALSPLKELNEDREILRKQILAHRQEEARLSDELLMKTHEHRAWMVQTQREAKEKRREEQKRRDTDNEREQLKRQLDDFDEEGWNPELQLAQQTIIYLRKLEERMRAAVSGEEKSPSTTDTFKEHSLPKCDKDEMAILPKNQREEVFYFAPTKKKPGKKSKKHFESITQPLVHDITTLADFERLGISPPLSLEDCPFSLKAMEAKLEKLQEEQQNRLKSSMKKKLELQSRLAILEAKLAEISPKRKLNNNISSSQMFET